MLRFVAIVYVVDEAVADARSLRYAIGRHMYDEYTTLSPIYPLLLQSRPLSFVVPAVTELFVISNSPPVHQVLH
jgi:hypothetical protein